MKPQRWAVWLHDFVLNPKSWLWICPALLLAGTLWYGDVRGGALATMAAPVIFVGALLLYWLTAATEGPAQVLAMSGGFGALLVLTAAFEEGVRANDARDMFVVAAALILIMKAVAVYVAPIWTRESPDSNRY